MGCSALTFPTAVQLITKYLRTEQLPKNTEPWHHIDFTNIVPIEHRRPFAMKTFCNTFELNQPEH